MFSCIVFCMRCCSPCRVRLAYFCVFVHSNAQLVRINLNILHKHNRSAKSHHVFHLWRNVVTTNRLVPGPPSTVKEYIPWTYGTVAQPQKNLLKTMAAVVCYKKHRLRIGAFGKQLGKKINHLSPSNCPQLAAQLKSLRWSRLSELLHCLAECSV